MIEYPTVSADTARKLRDAGFPQGKWEIGEQYWNLKINYLWQNRPLAKGDEIYGFQRSSAFDGADMAYAPSLAELIEACGERFEALRADRVSNPPETWWASKGVGVDTWFNQETPEEAVAHLYLALNERKNK